MFNEFKKFIAQGNVLDLAVGVIIGASFGKITTSLVNDIVMPPIGFLLSGVNFKEMAIQLGTDATGKAVVIAYGNFLQVLLEFLITAYVIFLVVKAANSMRLTDKKTDEKA